MKKYLLTSGLTLLAAIAGVQAQNYIGGAVYIGGPVYDASATNGTNANSSASVVIGSGGNFMFNSAIFTTPRSPRPEAWLTPYFGFDNSTYNRTSGYINGYAKAQNQAANFVLPIGQTSYMPLQLISATSGTAVSAAWYDAKPTVSTFILEPGGGSGAEFTFLPGYYDITSTDTMTTVVDPTEPFGVTSSTHLLTTKDGINFKDVGLATATHRVVDFDFQIRFANKGIILPLTITSFSASKKSSTTGLLTWKISTEQNIATYSIERSNDGRSFNPIGSVTSLGNTLAERTYTFTDLQPLSGSNYYRLKIIEKDGETSYTSIRILNWSNAITVAVFPNPVKDYATVTGLESHMLVNLINQQGQVMERLKVQGNTLQVPMAMLAAGTYHIQVLDKNGLLLTEQTIVKQ